MNLCIKNALDEWRFLTCINVSQVVNRCKLSQVEYYTKAHEYQSRFYVNGFEPSYHEILDCYAISATVKPAYCRWLQ